ncbi:replication restart helicase PriA [Lentiprolixibacter aurantiacus]|uniref:Replication restart protein PriA n=1 Tax=Lentiprolixibacter aurantiacus TaxID=2993939 RepID=A0AAE3SQ65_9FLAO|nr:primosomal protein N' [Lentiprolixibacter aurantiacus]MCX2720197.1 primosomal protein N' [Lentiprolixibacter aurantiacus]
MANAYYIDVILPIPLERAFTYAVTPSEADELQPGMRVAVPFGKNKIYTALVYRIHQNAPEVYEAKPLHQILDQNPVVNGLQLKHWEWMASYYMCTLGEVFRAALPGPFLLESETLIIRNQDVEVAEQELTDNEFLIYEALQYQESLRINDLMDITGRKTILPIINSLINKGVVLLKEILDEQYKPKMVCYVDLHEQYSSEEALSELLDSLSRAPKQYQVILKLFQLKGGSDRLLKAKELQKESGASASILKALVKKGVLLESWLRTDRVSYKGDKPLPPKALNSHQKEALKDIVDQFGEDKVVLLHGVTSSGKTEIYVNLVQSALRKGKQVLYLLPEIALTTQLIARLQQYFGDQLSVYHSRYNAQERVEVWNNVLHQKVKAQLVVGARSALFLPFQDLGLVIVDEEHETSYKQFDPAPRYHARDAAIVLGKFHGSDILLGSATPSLESFHNARTGKYGFARISRRYGNVLMPEIELVDIKDKIRRKRMQGHFSDRLILEIEEALKDKEQVIIFQNRRGYAPVLECQTCGHCPQCPNCDVSLTYHRTRNQLRCHYCGHNTALHTSCEACGSNTLDTKGFGTEQVEQELKELFPEACIARMDLDTTRGKHAYRNIITSFEEQEIDILVGTQMVTKGLDFRHVKLVGIMNADALLNFPDFRAHERSFQLLTQVAGRAGRTKKRGKVIVQSYNPYHQILKQVSTGDYESMYSEQLYEREQFQYPPTYKVIKITLKHRDFNKLSEASAWFAQGLRNIFRFPVLGPEFPPVARIRNQYLKNILIKIPPSYSLSKTKNGIKRLEQSFNAIAPYRGVRIIYNVDYF